jgi:hypothetical protein
MIFFYTLSYRKEVRYMEREKKFWKILLISFLLTLVSLLGSTAYAQKIQWILYDDFETVSKSINLWQLGTRNMCEDHNPDFQNGRMFQEVAVPWYNSKCSPESVLSNRIRSWARPLAAPYLTGIAARVTLDQYQYMGYYSNNIRGRLGAIFYNDGFYDNEGDGTDYQSEMFAGIDIRPYEVRWYVARLDKSGAYGETIATGQLFLNTWFFPPPPPTDLTSIPFSLKLWFDGTRIYFSAEIEKPSGEVIKAESTYSPVGEILPPKTPPFTRLESIIDMYYSPFPSDADNSYIKNEWDDVWVAVEATNLGSVKQLINNASKKNKKN